MFIPISTDTTFRKAPIANYGLIAANILVFLLQTASSATGGLTWIDRGSIDGSAPRLYEFITYQFLHGDALHIGGNMLFLWVFGNPVNAKVGDLPYLFFYLAGGVFAAVGYTLFNNSPMVGASGSIAAVTTAYLALYPRSHIRILYWFLLIGTFEMPSIFMIVFKIIIWDNVLAPNIGGGGNVAYSAHLAGYFFGFVSSVGLLLFHVLPRDQFDVVAVWKRAYQRHQMRTVMADPEARARAQFGTVARPVSVNDLGHMSDQPLDAVSEFRLNITKAFGANDRVRAAELYEKLLEVDPRQVLSRQHQIDVANQLYTMRKWPQAAAAYEKYLAQYANSPDADQVKLLLGIIYARDLQQYEIAQEHLQGTLERITDEKRRDQCRHWLDVANDALRGPSTQL